MKKSLKFDYFQIIQIMFGLMFCLLLLPSNLKAIAIAIFGILIITYSILKKNKFNIKFFFLNGLTYIALLLTLLYSNNWTYGWFMVQTMSSLLLFPLILSFLNQNDIAKIFKHLRIYFWFYIIAVNIFNILPFLWYLFTQDTLNEIIVHYPRVIIIDFGKYSIHPIYTSMHTCIAVLFSIHLYRITFRKSIKIVILILIAALILFLFIYLRKGPFIALCITLFIWSFFEARKYLKYNVFFIIILVSLLAIFPKTRNKFLELTKIETNLLIDPSSTNIRYAVYKNSITLIKKSPLIGYGIGDYNAELERSNKKSSRFLFDKNYNSHNQYLSFVLIGGFGLLLIFLFFFYRNIVLAISNNNILLILILVFYGTMMFFENILERENGVIFVAFFINFFALKNYIKLEKK